MSAIAVTVIVAAGKIDLLQRRALMALAGRGRGPRWQAKRRRSVQVRFFSLIMFLLPEDWSPAIFHSPFLLPNESAARAVRA